jgi:prepilin-type N-terminal cleavage/methylation domain-containing protein
MGYQIQSGFTLAELLIALAILGVIATFTIPKVLSAQQNGQYMASAKEAASMISGALQQYKLQNGSALPSTGQLTAYMNYVAVDTTSVIDWYQGSTTQSCSAGSPSCLRLHSGGILFYWISDSLCSSSSPSGMHIGFDPDGKVTDGTTGGPGKSVDFWIYSDGRIRTWGTIEPNTSYTNAGVGTSCNQTRSASPSKDPPWFSW